ncbi:MAG: relaxase/mobilization nuclease domain-containing protein [Rhizomicrobium sp.]
MIIKGKSRAGPAALAKHLGNAETNERVTLLGTRGTVAEDLRGALLEMDAYAAGTRCEKSLYHAAISPGPQYRLTEEQREQAFDALEAKLGFEGHARVVVLHEKLGRQHFHVVWSRIDLDQMKSISDSHNYRKHEEVSRELERLFGHEKVQGAHHERDGVKRPDRTPSRSELRQEERTGIKGKQVKEEITQVFRSADNAETFRAALEDAGYVLAKGDRRDFVVIDRGRGIHSLARRIDDIKAAELRGFMSSIDREALPDIEKAKEIAASRRAAVEELEEVRSKNLQDKAYARGDDYVSQSSAAQKDHKKRQARLNEQGEAIRMFDYGDPDRQEEEKQKARRSEENDRRRRDQEDKDKKAAPSEGRGSKQNTKEPPGEVTDQMARAFEKLQEKEESGDGHDDDPDRQREAPGGGRTRSR